MTAIDQTAPNFNGVIQNGDTFTLSDACKEHAIVLYFYPKDMTSGCTKQAEDFRDVYQKLLSQGIRVIGVSKDSEKSHLKFIEKHQLPFDLIADTSKEICDLYQCMVQKSMYGRQYMGVERSTFFIDKHQMIRGMWRNVKVPGHVEMVVEHVMSTINEA